jgi:hypothetical protein
MTYTVRINKLRNWLFVYCDASNTTIATEQHCKDNTIDSSMMNIMYMHACSGDCATLCDATATSITYYALRESSYSCAILLL